jgi:hypothetical protein
MKMTEPLQINDNGPRDEGRHTGLHAILPHRLHVAELVQTKVGKFAAKAAFFTPPKATRASLALKPLINTPPHSSSRENFSASASLGKDRGRQAKVAVVGQRQGARVFRDVMAATGPNSSWRKAVIEG